MTAEHAKTSFESIYGEGLFHCFSFGPHEEDNVLVLEAGPEVERPLVRVQSACYTAEIFRSVDCDCHEQLETSLRRIHAEGGVVVYVLCDGRGAGLLNKVRGLALGEQGLDTADAYRELRLAPDPRDYDHVARVLTELGITELRLLTNNPRKLNGLRQAGLDVEREPLLIEPTDKSRPYLKAKQDKLGHLLELSDR